MNDLTNFIVGPQLLPFILRVLEITAFDHCDDIWWRTDTEYAPVRFFVNCSDLFWWGTADSEDITPDNVELLAQSYADCTAAGQERAWSGGLLFCARVRKLRPQGAYYTHLDERLWPLFDACGPAREVDFANPKKQGETA